MQKYPNNGYHRTIGIYDIYEQIGAGSGGEVYRAYHRNLNKEVVLKRLKANRDDAVNVRQEVDVLKNLRHSCLPQVLDFLDIDNEIFTVMDYIPGKSFEQYLKEGVVFPEKSVLDWGKQICSTLEYLHSQMPPIVHSDLKPANIMLMPNGKICLIDFNVAASLGGAGAFVTGYTKGYASPEQIMAFHYNERLQNPGLGRSVDGRTDIYSWGATIYHMLTGVKPQLSNMGTVRHILEIDPDINRAFAAIIMKCLEPDPSRRYPNATLLYHELENLPPLTAEAPEDNSKKILVFLGIAAAMVAVTALGIIGYFRLDAKRRNDYDEIVRKEAECNTVHTYEDLEKYFQDAIDINSKRLDAYYEKAVALNYQGRYLENIDFITTDILGKSNLETGDGDLANVYYLLGNAYEQIQDYGNAALNYKRAIDEKDDVSNYYRDYAIALSYCGNKQEAQRILDLASEKGLDSVELTYVEGEMAYNDGRYSEAKDIFQKCVLNSDDDYIRMRAYLMQTKCLDAIGKGSNELFEKMTILEEARESLPREYNIGILESLSQTYSDMAVQSDEDYYYGKAAEVVEQIRSQGMGGYDTDYNLSVLYSNTGEYDKAADVLNHMIQDYGDNYKNYKALAFLEIAKQGSKDQSQKDYSAFQDYYLKTKELYKQAPNNGNDLEMDRLDELYGQAISNGWIRG